MSDRTVESGSSTGVTIEIEDGDDLESLLASGGSAAIDPRPPSEVWERFSNHWIEDGKSPNSLQPIGSAWGQFSEWMEVNGVTSLAELDSSSLAQHDSWIVGSDEYHKKPISRREHLKRLRRVLKYASARDWAPESAVPTDDDWQQVLPSVSRSEEIRDDPLETERGEQITRWLAAEKPCSRDHVIWLLLFEYGLRVSAIRAIDLNDAVLSEPEEFPGSEFHPHIRLRDRPGLGGEYDAGLPLKNTNPEYADRLVPLYLRHAEAIREYIFTGTPSGAESSRKEFDVTDSHDRVGLLTTEQSPRVPGRTIRERSHHLTCPTTYREEPCDCDGCEAYRAENGRDPYPSKRGAHCERTRSPHQVRHGSATKLLDQMGPERVARIVGTAPDTLREVYDRADEYRQMERVADAMTNREEE
ncbi:hypothetical protein BRD08_09195 [Halobacteriales archaeon SW_10_66_29]|nr:MAG: hypothetical protein BRD08_09195 [Halobacteriales archaeon SW_10_66_29]